MQLTWCRRAKLRSLTLPDLEMLQEVILVEGEVVAALALVDVLRVTGDVVLVLMRVVALEVTLGALELLQLTL